jgi:hypothetical protein
MARRIIVLPEELEVIETRLEGIEKELKSEHRHMADPILDTEGVMSLLKVSRRSLQNWRQQGLIEFSAINGKFYYRISAIDKMLKNHLQIQKNN